MEDEKIEQALEKCMAKETKKPKRVKSKKNPHWSKVYEQLRDEDLRKLGYIK